MDRVGLARPLKAQQNEDQMTKRLLAPLVLFALAGLVQVFAHQGFGSRYHQAVLAVLTGSLVADGFWLVAKRISEGDTFLPTMPVYKWLFRAFSLAALLLG